MARPFTTWEQHVDRRFEQLEALMADVTQALTDLATAVQKIGTNLQGAIERVNADVADLQAQIASGDAAKLQEVADSIEAQVADLSTAADSLAAIDPIKPVPPPVPLEPPS